MKVDALSLVLPLMLLWMPGMFVVSRSMRERLKNPSRNRRAATGSMPLTPLKWIDLVLAAGGLWVLRELAITVEPGVTGIGALVLLVQPCVLAAAAHRGRCADSRGIHAKPVRARPCARM